MKFSCDKYVLQQAAASAARAAAAKSPIPTLEGLLIEAGASVRITGYDLKKAIYTTIDADIPEPGSVLIGARLFCEMLRRMPDGSLQPLGLPVWRWDTFYIEIIRSIFDGAWDSDAAGARAVNYWWGMRSGAEEIDYSKDLPAGTLQLLDLMEKMLSENNLRIFPEDLYAQGHVLHSPEAVVYSPKELMEMDWLDECVEGGLPHYDELDVKTHTLMSINGINTLKGFVK